MERPTKVAVFESNQPKEIQLIKSKLEESQIPSFLEEPIPSDPNRISENMKRLFVDLKDEAAAFKLIDEILGKL